jgi:signal peptidase
MKDIQEKKWFKISKIVLNVIFYTLIVVLLLFSIANINKKDQFSVPNIFGKGFSTVVSPSMEGSQKDSFTTEDLIFLDVVTDSNRDKKLEKLEIGDIIMFKYFNNDLNEYVLNTHRIVDIVEINGKTTYVTQGDKRAETYPDDKYDPAKGWEELFEQNKIELVSGSEVAAVYTGKWVGAGAAFKFVQTSNGFLLCVVLPVALFFLVELVLLLLNFMKIRQQKRDEQHAEEMERIKAEQAARLEEEKARIRAEILAEQAKQEKEEEADDKK